MKLKRENEKLIVEIDLWQKSYDALDNEIGSVSNVVGVIAGDFEQGIYQVNDLGYKDSTQLGSPIVMTYFEDEEFRKICEELKINVWEYETCSECNKTLWGGFTINKEGKNVCLDCLNK